LIVRRLNVRSFATSLQPYLSACLPKRSRLLVLSGNDVRLACHTRMLTHNSRQIDGQLAETPFFLSTSTMWANSNRDLCAARLPKPACENPPYTVQIPSQGSIPKTVHFPCQLKSPTAVGTSLQTGHSREGYKRLESRCERIVMARWVHSLWVRGPRESQ